MQNVGSIDRIVRVVAGLALLALWFVLPGGAHYLALVGLVPLFTATIGFCPVYSLLGIRTNGAGGATPGKSQA
ncbi:MAG TPA: DUF2892 domain-containing protein [Polyangia bacterium]|jgi:hypothetical protein